MPDLGRKSSKVGIIPVRTLCPELVMRDAWKTSGIQFQGPKTFMAGTFLGDATVKPLRNHIASAIDMSNSSQFEGPTVGTVSKDVCSVRVRSITPFIVT